MRRQSAQAKSVNTESLRRSRVAPGRGVSPRLCPTASREPGCLQTGLPPLGEPPAAALPMLPSAPVLPLVPMLLSVPMLPPAPVLPRVPRFAACAVGLRPCGRSVRSRPASGSRGSGACRLW